MAGGLPTDKWKRTVEHYVGAATALQDSMASRGYDRSHPVLVDPNGELLDGSHRVACALAHGITHIGVEHRDESVWAPPWDYTWFVKAGMPMLDLNRLIDDWERICAPCFNKIDATP